MHRTHIILLLQCTLLLLLSACSGKKGEHSVNPGDIVIIQTDTSLRATLHAIEPDSLCFTADYDSTQFIRCNSAEAQQKGQVFGSITQGCRYAVLIDRNHNTVQKMYNLTELAGQWFFDKEEGRGFTFSVSGALSSINPKDVSMRKWKFLNGHIVIFYTGIEEVIEDHRKWRTDTTDIQSLSAEELTFTFRGETLHCTRQHEALKFHL